MKNLIAGVDEAGRGPVIGPLVICLAEIKKEKEILLKELGVKDSKLLLRGKREEILKKTKKFAKFYFSVLQPKELIERMKNTSLTNIEMEEMVRLTNKSNAEKIIFDCPSMNKNGFKRLFLQNAERRGYDFSSKDLIFEHSADLNHLIVGLASIFAKEKREDYLDKLKRKYGDFGSGYPSDPKTKIYLTNNPELSIIRTNWETWKRIDSGKKQKSLGDF